MKIHEELETWLPWVIKIRFVIITFVFAIEYAIRGLVPYPTNTFSLKYLAGTIILWYVLGLFFLIYNQLSSDFLLQAYLQLYSDIVVITALVHVTGDLESHFLSLYLVAIILASVLLPRANVFLIAAVSFVFMGATLEMAYLPTLPAYRDLVEKYPHFGYFSTASQVPVDLGTLQVKIFVSLFGFFLVAYLSSYLGERLRRAGKELQDQRGQMASLQAMTENIFQSMRDGLITTDLEGKILESNPAGTEILGRNPVALRGQPLSAFFPSLELAGRTGPLREETTYGHPDGNLRVLGVSVSPLVVEEAGAVGYVFNFQDRTEEKRREAEYRAKNRMASLGRLSAGIAHEIRNPLASIAGSVKLLQKLADLDEDQAKLIGIVSKESERLNKLVSDFLLYARDQRFEFRETDLVNLLEETLLLVEHHPLFGPGYRLERKFPRQPVMASVDADKVRQIFWNICDNSLKAMPHGGNLTAQIEWDDGLARIVLADTGVGFAEAQLEKLFEPFQSGFSDGTGLGLAIVKHNVELYGGAVEVESELGKGTRFVLYIPTRTFMKLRT